MMVFNLSILRIPINQGDFALDLRWQIRKDELTEDLRFLIGVRLSGVVLNDHLIVLKNDLALVNIITR